MSAVLADEGGNYQIRVLGRLDPRWAHRLGGMTLVVRDDSEPVAVTDLSGWVTDQAALMGVLGQLYALGLTLVSVDRLETNKEGSHGRHEGHGR